MVQLPGDSCRLQGQVRQADILPCLHPEELRASQLSYDLGAHSNWHVHTGEQALVVISGRGLVQWEGLDRPVELHAGDWVGETRYPA